ncbi:protein NPC2-like [Tropilaelaps mercedesae]|uniref:Protein NPC2-like n=1 Tax=Tropilaelaps mercedesae TaxID=418985 RepID=A0A1V9X7V1_9ACAR|nr:protein NPC2-like [Tropilaelaps mercedesae]
MALNRFVVLIALVAVGYASPFKSCDSKDGSILSLDIEGCPDDNYECILHKGDDAKISITFTPNVNSNTVMAKAFGIIAGIPIPYAIPESNACLHGLVCPLKSGVVTKYSQTFPVQRTYPSLALEVKWMLIDDRGDAIVCAKIPVRLQ